MDRTLGKWQGPVVQDLKFPVLKAQSSDVVNYNINRDQIIVIFAGLSVDRVNAGLDKLLLFDQILCGGVLGSMSSRLFQLREQTGLFYTIGGSISFHNLENNQAWYSLKL